MKDNFEETSGIVSRSKLYFIGVVIFLFKFSILLYLVHLNKCQNPDLKGGHFSFFSGDAYSYIAPVENFISEHNYHIHAGSNLVSAGRMPYYGVIYFVFRQVVSPVVAYDLLSILQIILEVIAIIYLSLLTASLLKTVFAFWCTVIIASLSFFVSYWSIYVLPESFSISLLIFFLYHYFNYKVTQKKTYFFFYALFFALLVSLKPYFILFLFFPFVDIATGGFAFSKFYFAKALKLTLITLCVLFALLSPWIIRNYFVFHRFIPFQESIYAGFTYSESDLACRRFIAAWGGSSGQYWDKRSAACYFIPRPNVQCQFTFPDYAFTSGYSLVDIDSVRSKYVFFQKHYSDSLNEIISHDFDRLTTIYKTENPFHYYLISPLLITKIFLFHSGSYYLPISPSFNCYQSWQFGFKLLQSVIYYFTLLAGFAGLLILFIRNRSSAILLAVPCYLIALFCFYLKASEFRYFNHSHPVLILGSVYLVILLIQKLSKKNLQRN